MFRKVVALFLGFLILMPSFVLAGPTIPGFYGGSSTPLPAVTPNTLPTPRGFIQGVDRFEVTSNRAVIYQNQPKAIIDWNTFDIGKDASVHFDQQKNSNWSALNRIWDKNPSQIFGALTADGHVYLINQNGILFGPGSKVNIHSLIASSLNITNSDFLTGILKFKAENYNGRDDNFFYDLVNNISGTISNHGVMETDNMGSLFLIGPKVENSGTIITPIGQIGLVAGTELELALPVSGDSILFYPGGESRTARVIRMIRSPEGSFARNMESGSLASDTGLVGMYGRVVNQDGLIRSVTAVQQGGHVELFASEKITTGPKSLIVLPVSDSPDKTHISFPTTKGDITLSGLDPNNPGIPHAFAKRIELEGEIAGPSSLVTLNATERVYIESGSRIDVSGLWIDKSANFGLLEVQMNSVNLRDSFAQKGGVLQGQTIKMSSIGGSTIGDVSGAFSTEGLTAIERHTTGGQIMVNLAGNPLAQERIATGDVIIREGALIDFSGGGNRYGIGSLDTTRLLSGTTIYDISNADPNIHYEKIINLDTVKHERFGITEKFAGLYYGGASPVKEYVQAHKEGNDAGSLSLQARQVILDGTILGSAEKGLLQNMTSEPLNAMGNQTKSGYREPTGGKLMIGNTEITNYDGDIANFFVQEIIVAPESSQLPSSFKPDDVLGTAKTVLSAKTLSNAGLSSIALATNTSLKIEEGAKINLLPGGVFKARARRIDHYGEIISPGGTIQLGIETNITTNPLIDSGQNPNYIPLQERIYVAEGSRLIAAGERIDNTLLGVSALGKTMSGHLNGGSIEIMDKTVTGEGVAIMPDAVVDVSGGYQIDAPNRVVGGNAGTLSLQGYSLVVEGDLRAHSVLGKAGGAINFHAGNVFVVDSPVAISKEFLSDSPWPEVFRGKLFLGNGQLDATGFTKISLTSVKDINVQEGTTISPSLWKLANPVPGEVKAETPVSTSSGTVRSTLDDIGSSSMVALRAGVTPQNLTFGHNPTNIDYPMKRLNLDARIDISRGASVDVSPGGSVEISGPYVEISGSVIAPSGRVNATARYDLNLKPGGAIFAEGYDKLSTTPLLKGLPLVSNPVSGGSVNLTSGADLILSPGSLVSVSGSSPVQTTILGPDGHLYPIVDASNPGSIGLKALGMILMDGKLKGEARIPGLPGGSISIEKTDPLGSLSVNVSDLKRIREGGFDMLALSSAGELNLSGRGQVTFGRSLTLSAPRISVSDSDSIDLIAPWVQLTNQRLPSPFSATSGDGILRLSANFLDVTGDITFSGLKRIELEATRDLRFADALYKNDNNITFWSGFLKVPRDLTLKAARVYPTGLSRFNVEAGGKVEILPSGRSIDGPVYSAAGSLTIKAGQGIEQRGYLAVPMGTIALDATGSGGRVYLAEGSVTTTQAKGVVKLGDIQSALGENIWGVIDKDNPNASVPYSVFEQTPGKSVSINGAEVIVREGATVDTSGGGVVFTYQFFPGTSGTVSPLQKTGRYVIMPDNNIVMPGKAVYLSGVGGLKAGVYSLLPAEFAFLPGAMILTDLGTKATLGDRQLTKEGYTIVAGYETFTGSNIRSKQFKGYELRSASEVLKEGNFAIQSKQAGEAGTVILAGDTTIIDGSIRSSALPGYSGGSIALSGSNVTVLRSAIPLPSGFDFSTSMPSELTGRLNIAGSAISGQGFSTIGLGFADLDDPVNSIKASQVKVEEGVVLKAENVILAAKDMITIGRDAQVLGLTTSERQGETSLIAPTGKAVIGEGAMLHASHAVKLQAADLDLRGTLLSDNSALNLKGKNITFVRDDYVRTSNDTGLFLSESQWRGFSGFADIQLTSLSDLIFKGNFDLSVKDVLTVDAGSIMGLNTGSTVRLTAPTIHLLNTAGTNAVTGGIRTGQLTLESMEIEIGKGNILIDSFASIDLNAQKNLIFKGAGALQTGGGDLNITSARITTSHYLEPAAPVGSKNATLSPIYTAANFNVDAGTTGTIRMLATTGSASTTSTPGGTLDVKGKAIEIYTLLEVPSGQITLTATNNVVVKNGAQVLAKGTNYAPGGVMSLMSTNGGSVSLEAGSVIDVSAGVQGKAGSISLYAPVGGALLGGDIRGQGNPGGQGGSLVMVTNNIDNFAALNSKLASGGFNESLDVCVTSGNISIASGDTIKARQVKLTADAGSIDLVGAIDVTQPDKGGAAEVYAKQDLSISGNILARGTGTDASGGAVSLGADTGILALNGGSIDVSGSGTGAGGTVTFRSQLTGPAFDTMNMSLAGTLMGASSVVAEAVRTYTDLYPSITLDAINAIQTNTYSFMSNNASSLKTNLLAHLGGIKPDQFHVRPGIVVQQTTGDISLDQDWDLTAWRYGGEAGTLTLRAAGNLNINGNLIDNPTNSYQLLRSDSVKPSWGVNLIAGAESGSADFKKVKSINTQGHEGSRLFFAPQKVVYTESGPVVFASGGDTVVNDGPLNNFMVTSAMKYSIATYSGDIQGNVKGSLTINAGGAIQSATGNIDLQIGGCLNLNKNSSYSGTIRTTGEHASSQSAIDYLAYSGGGNIDLHVGGNIESILSNAWLTAFINPVERWQRLILPIYSSSALSPSTEGIVAMAGGNVSIRSGGTFSGQAGTFGTGDLIVFSGGDLKGRFLVKEGTGNLITMGNFGSRTESQLIEAYAAQIAITAQGDIELGAVLNPTLAVSVPSLYWDNKYKPYSGLHLRAVEGDVNIYGSVDIQRYGTFYRANDNRNLILPSSVEITAGKDINLYAGSGLYTMLPSSKGNLRFEAGRDIVFLDGARLNMSDADTFEIYSPAQRTVPDLEKHAFFPVHSGDPEPVIISAARDIKNVRINLPKMADIRAGRDIIDLDFSGQNIQATDTTLVVAQRDIRYGYSKNESSKKMELGGPGFLEVQAAGTIDLGNAEGIKAVGNFINKALDETSSSVVVSAGIRRDLTPETVKEFFADLRIAGIEYSNLQSAGDSAGAQERIERARVEVVAPFIGTVENGRDINMTSSQISTTGGGDVYVVSTGTLNVGKTALNSNQGKSTGIFTSTGGAVSVFTVDNINVNEARVMTFRGGDITVWSDLGDINAGRGSKAVINAGSPEYSCDKATGVCSLKFNPPAVGSGIRALTYDPDDAGPLVAPLPGDAYLFAPQGVIDAGEAGISGGNIILGATAVLNAGNISFSGGSVGVPTQTEAVNLGALTGTTNLTDKNTLSTESLGPVQGKDAEKMLSSADDIMKWLEVKVINFDMAAGVVEEEEKR